MLRKTLCRILCCIAIFCLAASSVYAAEPPAQKQETGTIVFDFSRSDAAVTGGAVNLRLVAMLDLDTKTLSWAPGFAEAGLELDALVSGDAERVADFLFYYAESKELPAEQIEIGLDGKGRYENAALGVYLLSQTEPFAGYECILPALISVPVREDGVLNFCVEALPKLRPLHEVPPPSETPPPPDLPYTGQVNWPVPILAFGGCLLILLGLLLHREKQADPSSPGTENS